MGEVTDTGVGPRLGDGWTILLIRAWNVFLVRMYKSI